MSFMVSTMAIYKYLEVLSYIQNASDVEIILIIEIAESIGQI